MQIISVKFSRYIYLFTKFKPLLTSDKLLIIVFIVWLFSSLLSVIFNDKANLLFASHDTFNSQYVFKYPQYNILSNILSLLGLVSFLLLFLGVYLKHKGLRILTKLVGFITLLLITYFIPYLVVWGYVQ